MAGTSPAMTELNKASSDQVRAFAVHVLTASGAGIAFIALIFATGEYWEPMFLALGLALIVDGLDGPLARKFDIAQTLPRWSGDILDLVVDFTTYVFVPAYAIAASGLISCWLGIAAGLIVCVSGALYFADKEMKTRDNYFQGFPAVWNVVAFYVFLLQPLGWISFLAIAVLAGLSFAPVKFVHPLRVPEFRALNIVLMAAWGVLALWALIDSFAQPAAVTWALGAIAVYFLLAGLLRQPRVEEV
jgi:phosphatidylcholine synthase